jgi:methionyl-tRNA synthetase
MSDKKSFYITTTIPYVNAEPHIGFALEIIQADTMARAKRLQGAEVFFSTGSDEHGQKIWEAAEKAGKDVQEYVDHYAATFEKLKEALNLSNDNFIRTTSEEHRKAAQEMWKRCKEKGDIYEKEFEGLYCVGCERFLTERDIVEGKCLIHQTEPQLLKEKNWFFRLSKYEKQILDYLNNPETIIPSWRREEAIAFVKEGLEDFSISRDKSRLSWGVPVPEDETQVMYVWFDALTNYISTLGWPNQGGNFQRFWQEGYTVQMAGKDQVRFQSIMWQGILFSAGIKNTDQVFYHGFINSGGTKMSKSLGNVISPYGLVEKYGTDATRYLLLRHVHPTDDTDVTWERLDEWYNANLANGLGNLTSRIMTLAASHLESPVTISDREDMSEFFGLLDAFEFNKAANYAWEKIGELDREIQEKKPWESKDKAVISELVVKLYSIARMLNPLMPETSATIKALVKANKKPDTPLFLRKDA